MLNNLPGKLIGFVVIQSNPTKFINVITNVIDAQRWRN